MGDALELFFNAWGMSDADARKTAISKAITNDGTYADPRTPSLLEGIDAIASYVAMFSENAPGWEARIVKTDDTQGTMRATVAFGGKGPDGTDMEQQGQYFADFDGDQISRLIGFVGTGEPA